LVQPLFGDRQRKQNLLIICAWRLCKGQIQRDLGFIPLLVHKLSADLALSCDVADMGGTGQSLNGQLDALGSEKFGRRKCRCGHADVLLKMKGSKYP
jgi:hypothetical protein